MKSTSLDDFNRFGTRALMLVPTKELSEQTTTYLKKLLVYCDKEIAVANVAAGTSTNLQR